ncbi:MAG: hypothetical protein HW380_1678 [Magnetococcales bacterium]|nr:hypothetical protein [Magnetococcales bacterium]
MVAGIQELGRVGIVIVRSPRLFFFKNIAGVRGGSSPPAGFGAEPQGFGFEFKQKASCLWGFGGEAPKVLFFYPKGIMSRRIDESHDEYETFKMDGYFLGGVWSFSPGEG